MDFIIDTIHHVEFSCTDNGELADQFNTALEKLVHEEDDIYLNNDSLYKWRWCWILESTNLESLTAFLPRVKALADEMGLVLINDCL
jgi:hypothetical protein